MLNSGSFQSLPWRPISSTQPPCSSTTTPSVWWTTPRNSRSCLTTPEDHPRRRRDRGPTHMTLSETGFLTKKKRMSQRMKEISSSQSTSEPTSSTVFSKTMWQRVYYHDSARSKTFRASRTRPETLETWSLQNRITRFTNFCLMNPTRTIWDRTVCRGWEVTFFSARAARIWHLIIKCPSSVSTASVEAGAWPHPQDWSSNRACLPRLS